MLQKGLDFLDQKLISLNESIRKIKKTKKRQYSPSPVTSSVGFLLLLRYAIHELITKGPSKVHLREVPLL